MQYLLSEAENEQRVDALESHKKLPKVQRSLELARMLILEANGYRCHDDEGAGDYDCEGCPIGKLLFDSAIESSDWTLLCGRNPQFSH